MQIGVGGLWIKEWSQFSKKYGSTQITMEDIDNLGIEKVAEIALETAWKGCNAVYLILDIDVLDCAFCPGTGTPDFGGMLPRELLRLLRLVTKEGICGNPDSFHLQETDQGFFICPGPFPLSFTLSSVIFILKSGWIKIVVAK